MLDTEELSNTLKYLYTKYRSRYQFVKPECIVKIKRMFKKPGVQIDLLDAIQEAEI